MRSPVVETGLTGVELIAAERQRQIGAEGWSPGHDDSHRKGELARFGALYAIPPEIRGERLVGMLYPRRWVSNWWKPTPDNRVRELVKAGALIAAEIDRLQRLASAAGACHSMREPEKDSAGGDS